MHWLVQSHLLSDPAYAQLVENLDRMGVAHTFCTTIPFSEELETGAFDLAAFEGKVFPFGTYTLCRLVQQRAQQPQVFISDRLSQAHLLPIFGAEMLNSDMLVLALRDVVPPADHFFIRPSEDNKAFPAQVLSATDFLQFQQNILQLAAEGTFSYVTPDMPCVVATPKSIEAEFRFFVVKGKLSAYSQYRRGGRAHFHSHIDPYLLDYAQAMVDRYQPEQAYVLDIALSNQKMKILESNAIHASGLYTADSQKLIETINLL